MAIDLVLGAIGISGRTIFIGVDLGKMECPSAIVVLERFEEMPTDFADVLRGVGARTRYVVRQAERVALGTPYTRPQRSVAGRASRCHAAAGAATREYPSATA